MTFWKYDFFYIMSFLAFYFTLFSIYRYIWLSITDEGVYGL